MKSICYYRVYVINYLSKNGTTLIFINLNLRDVREKKIVSIDVINIPLSI